MSGWNWFGIGPLLELHTFMRALLGGFLVGSDFVRHLAGISTARNHVTCC